MTERKISSAGESLYNILEVDKTARKEDILNAYIRQASRCHPAKHPGDLDAALRYKMVKNAYSVLGDDERRDIYDRLGFKGIHLADQLDKNHDIDVDGYKPAPCWMRTLFVICGLATCCYFCYCCCYYCCNCCCGKYIKTPGVVTQQPTPTVNTGLGL